MRRTPAARRHRIPRHLHVAAWRRCMAGLGLLIATYGLGIHAELTRHNPGFVDVPKAQSWTFSPVAD